MRLRHILTTLFVAVAGSIALYAQSNSTLSTIEKGNARIQSLEASFQQTRKIVASGKTTKMEGTLYYASPESMAMLYTAPEGEYLIIKDNTLSMKRNGKASSYDTSKNAMMAQLRNTLLLCIKGKVEEAAAVNSAKVLTNEESDKYVVTLVGDKAATRGYTTIILKYSKKDCVLTEMETSEAAGIINHYTMTSVKKDGKVDPAVFQKK